MEAVSACLPSHPYRPQNSAPRWRASRASCRTFPSRRRGRRMPTSRRSPCCRAALSSISAPCRTGRRRNPSTAAIRLRAAGLEPVPHIAVRNFASVDALDDFLARLNGEAEVRRVLVIAGDRAEHGPFRSAADAIDSRAIPPPRHPCARHRRLSRRPPEDRQRCAVQIACGEDRGGRGDRACGRNRDAILFRCARNT